MKPYDLLNTLEADLPTLKVVIEAVRSVANESLPDHALLLDQLATELESQINEIATTGGPVEGD